MHCVYRVCSYMTHTHTHRHTRLWRWTTGVKHNFCIRQEVSRKWETGVKRERIVAIIRRRFALTPIISSERFFTAVHSTSGHCKAFWCYFTGVSEPELGWERGICQLLLLHKHHRRRCESNSQIKTCLWELYESWYLSTFFYYVKKKKLCDCESDKWVLKKIAVYIFISIALSKTAFMWACSTENLLVCIMR